MISETAREPRQHQDVHFGMPEDPEKVLPQQGGTARLRIEEAGPEIAVQEQHDLGRRQGWHGEEDHPGHDQQQPHEEGHPGQGHALAAHTEDRRHNVDAGGDAADATHQQAEDPVVGAVAAREGAFRQWGIGKPADVRRGASTVSPSPPR